MNNIENIEKSIAYVFADKKLLDRAFTHPSAESGIGQNYQVFEFLGDSIVGFVVADELIRRCPRLAEGQLTKIRAAVVSAESMSEIIDGLGVSKYLVMGKGEMRRKAYESTNVKGDLYESIVAAIYKDSGLDSAKEFILRTMEEKLSGGYDESEDCKSTLNEYASKHKLNIEYVCIKTEGPPHAPIYTFAVELDGKRLGEGKGTTKQEAQQLAASQAIKNVKI